MPTAERENREIVARIRYGQSMENVTNKALASSIGLAEWTIYQRYKDPNDFRLGELRTISKKLHISLAELLGLEQIQKGGSK